MESCQLSWGHGTWGVRLWDLGTWGPVDLGLVLSNFSNAVFVGIRKGEEFLKAFSKTVTLVTIACIVIEIF